MGVPKFYRWISERYPCLSEVVKEYQVPEFDNLYLDMNGIIHVCSHPNDDDPHFRITEEQIFKDIFHYIEVLFRIVCPRKVFFMAVDGVAPRAKMNQQRGRRFRSAKEAEENIKKALKKGEILPDEKRFDSNCITPGTKFMVRLQDELEYMVQSKISNDPSWQGISVYLSGHETPGEGEHKIMEFIRHERSQPEYDPNTRHCLYGLDADLMMLGLCSHEPHFSLLREEVRFTGKKSKNSRTAKPEETTFHLLHLSLMREYIEHEFDCLKNKLPFKFNLESIIDDWVLMGFLVGNDFIPHLPHLHIAHNALPMLYQTYKQVLPHLDGYLNDGGIVNLERFERYLVTLSEFDREKFGEQFDDLRWLESKTRKGKMGVESDSKGEIDSLCSLEEKNKSERENNLSHVQNKAIQVVKELSLSQGLISPDSECESNGSQDDSTFETEFQMFKRHYYQEKLHIEASDGVVAKIVYEYILAIQWICHYYYNGVQSWSWYYPYHYAPFLSDLCHLGRMKLHFSMETPFLPYQQLLAVLPAASKECLPEPYWDLMCSEHSPIIDYYPTEFQCDLNGKQQEWEAVVLIPFINEKRLLDAMKSREKKLTASEKARNRHSPCLLYQFDSNVDVFVKSSLPGTFPDIVHCKSRCDTIPLHAWNSGDTSTIVKGLLSGCRLSVYYPGFPTLYHISHTCYLKKQGVKVFQMPSKNENMILQILSPNDDEDESQFVGVFEGQSFKKGESLDDVAKNLLGCSIYVNWPHMEEAKVVAVSDGDVKYEVTEHIQGDGAKESKQKMHRKTLTDSECQTFDQDVDVIVETYMSRRGIKIGRTNFVVYAQPLLGRKYVCGRQGLITLEKQWAVKPQVYALQTTVKDIAVKDPTFRQFKGIEELFPVDSAVFMLGHPNYGCQGKVLSVHKGMTTVELETPVEPDIESVIKRRKKLSSTYYPGWVLASRIGISGYLLSRITGTIYVFYPTTRKWQLGLNLRFSKENSGIAGYTKVENREWSYSEAVAEILREYWEKFPEILSYLQSALNKNESDFDAAKMVKSDDVIGKLQEVSTWLKTLECYGGDKVNENSDMLELKVVQAINEKVQAVKKLNHETFQITIRPQDLYRPLAHQGTLLPDSNAQHKLLDRVVCVREAYTVPLGMRGAIIGIHKHPGQDVLYDVFFDEEFLGGLKFGGRCPDRRGYRMPECTIINLSYGKRLEMRSQKPMAVVKPQNNYGVQQQRFPGSPKRKDRNIRSNKETKPQAKRPQSSPLSPAKPVSIMQRNSKSSSAKGQQNSNQHIFENLWNTLKLQNKSDNDASSSSHTAKALPNSSTVAKNAAAELSTKQNENFFNASLTQAAKTLPKVQLTSLSSKNNSNNAVRSTCNSVEVPSNLSSAVSTLPEPVVTVETTKTSEESALTNARASECNHLDQLFKSIKISKSQRLAFTPTQPCSSYHPPNFILPPSALPPRNYFSMQQGSTRPVIPSNIVMSPYAYPRHPHPRLYPNQWPPRFLNRPRPLQQIYRGITNTITHSSILPTNSTASINSPVISDVFSKQATDDRIDSMTFTSSKMQSQEGMQKLCEMLNTDKENEDASSSKWSLGEDDQDHVENEEGTEEVIEEESLEKKEETKSETYSLKDEASDGDSVKDEEDYMERSTSVEDEKTGIIQTKTKVDELMSLCKKCSMLPPIYTYFTTGDDQVVSTVQLWNGVRFSSHSQVNRDKAMEEAAQHAINYLKTEQQTNRPVSTSPPSTYSYIASSQDLVQAAASVGNPYFVQATPYAPVTYSPPQPAYFGYPLSSHNAIPISVLPRGPVIAMSGFQHPAVVPSYRFDQVQYLPPPQPQIIQVQHSPTHHPNKGLPVYHPPSGPPKPIMWNGGRPVGPCFDTYTLQNSAVFQQPAVPPPRTQYQLRDTPFIPLQVAKQQVKSDPTPVTATSLPPTPTKQEMSESKDTKKQKMPVKITPLKSATSSKSSKAKLAISFDSGKV